MTNKIQDTVQIEVGGGWCGVHSMCFKGSGNITSPSWVVGAWMFIILV